MSTAWCDIGSVFIASHHRNIHGQIETKIPNHPTLYEDETDSLRGFAMLV